MSRSGGSTLGKRRLLPPFFSVEHAQQKEGNDNEINDVAAATD